MTEQTLEEQARDVYGEWLRNWNKEQRGAHQLIADFARAHAEREVEKARRLFFKALAERPVAPHPIDQLKNLQRAMTTDVEIEKLETELAALRARLDMIEKAEDWFPKEIRHWNKKQEFYRGNPATYPEREKAARDALGQLGDITEIIINEGDWCLIQRALIVLRGAIAAEPEA